MATERGGGARLASARLEDPDLVTGRVEYLADLRLGADAAAAAFVRSPIAAGRISLIDTSAALAHDGVLAVHTAADLGLGRLRSHAALSDGFDRPPLADGVVRFVGEPVAVVIASSPAVALDAVDDVDVAYEPSEPVLDPATALSDERTLFDRSNLAFEIELEDGDDVLDGADHVAHVECHNQRVAPSPMEPDGAVAVPDGEGGVTVWASTQRVHHVRDAIAAALGWEPHRVRVRAPAVGGGFGGKFDVSPEAVVVAAAAHRLGRTVGWVQTRSENLTTMPHGRDQSQRGALALDADGRFRGLWLDVLNNAGGYPMVGAVIPNATVLTVPGPYRIDRVGGRGRAAATNTAPLGAYRGAGRPEATALRERLVDVAARQLGLDPLELRRRNLLTDDDRPHTTATGLAYDPGSYRACLDAAAALVDYEGVRREQAASRAAGRAGTSMTGVAVVMWLDCTPMNRPGEHASIDVRPLADGEIEVVVRDGANDQGQGHRSAWATLIAGAAGLPPDRVVLEGGDTAFVPTGEGTGSARSLMLAGAAVTEAAEIVARQARDVAAHLLEAAPDDIVTGPAGLSVAGAPSRGVSWHEVAAAAQRPDTLPGELRHAIAGDRGVLGDGGLGAAVDATQLGPTFPAGAHAAVVTVDAETGAVRVERFVAVDDCGTVIDPSSVEGQQRGGIAQGIAQALYEEVSYDADGNPLTSTLAEYAVPAAADLPPLHVDVRPTPSPVNPLGAKGIGQAGAIGATVAVQNAVVDAVAHLGIDHLDLPATPERVWRAIRDHDVRWASA